MINLFVVYLCASVRKVHHVCRALSAGIEATQSPMNFDVFRTFPTMEAGRAFAEGLASDGWIAVGNPRYYCCYSSEDGYWYGIYWSGMLSEDEDGAIGPFRTLALAQEEAKARGDYRATEEARTLRLADEAHALELADKYYEG